ncbi:hypothetical protein BX600DRAFT_518980 [Xylariales sp. PMI_506]|nr:hypothetical protein BX600DRAFT_518980 [Xylariales sp. PMI_506]
MEQEFHPFTRLPLELQREVWRTALDMEPHAAVCIFGSNDELEPTTVDLSLPVLMHVCRESRSMVRRRLNFRTLGSDGSSLGPYREFQPAIDALYISSRDWPQFFDPDFLQGWSRCAELRNLALDQRVLSEDDVAEFASQLGYFPSLRTLSLVFSEEGWLPRDHVPTGRLRYRLVDCEEGDTVWDSPPGRVRREHMDPAVITARFEEMLAAQNIDKMGQAPYNKDTGEPLFVVVPKKIAHSPRASTRSQGWISSLFGGVQRLFT